MLKSRRRFSGDYREMEYVIGTAKSNFYYAQGEVRDLNRVTN